MDKIEHIIFSTPIPKNSALLNSENFVDLIIIKFSGMNKLLIDKKFEELKLVIKDIEAVEKLITNKRNLTFLRYVIGMEHIGIGLNNFEDENLQKGIDFLELIDETELTSLEWKSDYYRLFSKAIIRNYKKIIDKTPEYNNSFENIEPLLKSKYYLFKLYHFLIEKRVEIKEIEQAKLVSDLILNLLFLNRWNEPFFLLDKELLIEKYNSGYYYYLKAMTLNLIATKTCCNIYAALLHETKRYLFEAKKTGGEEFEWNEILDTILKDTDGLAKKHDYDLVEFGKSYVDAKDDFEEHTEYRKWCLTNHFSLCEHAVYCFCQLSKTDDLVIRTNHTHTQIKWVEPFEILLDKIKSDYNLSRYFLYVAEDNSKVVYKKEDEVLTNVNSLLLTNTKSDYLLLAFRTAYSILDKIARAIYMALEIEYTGNIYFHNCWKIIKQKRPANKNEYLFALYSIGHDLSDTSKFSALLEYKKWRNAIEHEYFFLVASKESIDEIKKEYPIIKEVIEIEEFEKKTFYLLQLCRSAIFSFTFFIRHESRDIHNLNACVSEN